MRKVSLVRHAYLGINVNSFVCTTATQSIYIDSGLFGNRAALGALMTGASSILSTHGHWDHIGAHRYLQDRGATVMAHFGDERFYHDHLWHWDILFKRFIDDFDLPAAREETFRMEIGKPVSIDRTLVDGQLLTFDDLCFQTIHTPGHSDGSLCFLEMTNGLLFTGDSLMEDGFFTGIPQYTDPDAYVASMNKLMNLKASTLYSAHNDPAPGELLAEKAERSIACVSRIDAEVRDYVMQNRDREEMRLGDVVSRVCMAEGKCVGAGACVTVLSHLTKLRGQYPAVESCIRNHFGSCGVGG
ncbi:MAG TPA: MBL fold metallo-hydrolase [Rectinemataceae bacterium]|nr:MBL fold metallo-hydrolase [Rectinemataceae bacterium]